MRENTKKALKDDQAPAGPVVELGVRGPRDDLGFLLSASTDEAFVWDLENEIGSSRLSWEGGKKGWWIASSYLEKTLEIALRFFPSVRVRDPETGEERVVEAEGKGSKRVGPKT
jgi:hypothetical protein